MSKSECNIGRYAASLVEAVSALDIKYIYLLEFKAMKKQGKNNSKNCVWEVRNWMEKAKNFEISLGYAHSYS